MSTYDEETITGSNGTTYLIPARGSLRKFALIKDRDGKVYRLVEALRVAGDDRLRYALPGGRTILHTLLSKYARRYDWTILEKGLQ